MTVRIPLTLAIIPALLVSNNGQRFAIPLGMVHRLEEFSRDEIEVVGFS